VAEIERCAKDKRFVGVMLVMGDILGRSAPTGRFNAAAERWPAVGIHAAAYYHTRDHGSAGVPIHIEDYVAQAQGVPDQLTSVSSGAVSRGIRS